VPRLLIDGSALTLQPKGVGRYSAQLIEQLSHRLPQAWMIQILTNAHAIPNFTGPNLPQIFHVLRLPDLIKGLCIVPLLAAAKHCDIVLIPMDVAAYAGARPLLSIVHDIPELIAAAAGRSPGIKRRLINWLRERFRRSMLRHSTVVVANSKFIAREAGERYHIEAEALRIGYCGVDDRFYEPRRHPIEYWWPRIGQWKGYFLGFATGDPRETYDLYPAICESLRRWNPDIGLVVAGVNSSADYAAALRQDFAQRGLLEGRDFLFVPFLGENEFGKLRALYRDADFYLELSAHEGFGMQLAEAMATGTTCISSGRGALREVGGGFPIELERLDAGCVADTLIGCYRQELHRRDNQAQIEFTRRYNWDSVGKMIAEELERLYEQICARKSGANASPAAVRRD
jgi:glycosyltransferase involved in cell wall biosynthesis